MGLLAALAALRPACIEEPPASGFDTAAMLANIADAVVIPALDDLADRAEAAAVVVAAWEQSGSATDLDAALVAWGDLAEAVQIAEMLQIGPAASSTSAVGGEDRRDGLYSWPTTNPCRVDQELVEQGYTEAGFFEDNLVNVFGLDALEYLLFHPDGNACAGQHPINDEGTWDALSDADLRSRRAAYASVVADRIAADAAELAGIWAPGGAFAGQLAGAGGDGSAYTTELSALNAVFDALFYLETQTKDAKLGVPLGVVEGCGAPPCVDALESRWAEAGVEHVEGNLVGFRALWTGGEGLGFDDLLVSIDQGALNDQLMAALDAADAAVAAHDGTLAEALVNRPEDVRALYDAVKAVADILKNDLPPLLVLQVPGEAGGDND